MHRDPDNFVEELVCFSKSLILKERNLEIKKVASRFGIKLGAVPKLRKSCKTLITLELRRLVGLKEE